MPEELGSAKRFFVSRAQHGLAQILMVLEGEPYDAHGQILMSMASNTSTSQTFITQFGDLSRDPDSRGETRRCGIR